MRITSVEMESHIDSIGLDADIKVTDLNRDEINYMYHLYRCFLPSKLMIDIPCSDLITTSRHQIQSELKIEKVIFNDPATIVFWSDKTKTVVKCDSKDHFSEEMGLAMACTKKLLGNNYTYYGKFDKALDKATRTLN